MALVLHKRMLDPNALCILPRLSGCALAVCQFRVPSHSDFIRVRGGPVVKHGDRPKIPTCNWYLYYD